MVDGEGHLLGGTRGEEVEEDKDDDDAMVPAVKNYC